MSRIARAGIVGLAFAVSCAGPSSPTPTPVTQQTGTVVDCSLVGSLPCQIPPPTLCLTQGASNYGQPAPCTFPPPADTTTPSPTPTPTPPLPTFPGSPPTPSYAVTMSAAPTSITIGSTSTLTATAVQANGAPVVASYEWDCDGNGTTDATTAGNSFTCTYITAGTITSHVTARGTGAVGAATVNITVNGAPLFVTITPSAFGPAVGANVTFTATVTCACTIPGTLKWEWDDDGNGTIEATDAAAASPNHRTISYATSGVKHPTVTVTDTPSARTSTGTNTLTVP